MTGYLQPGAQTENDARPDSVARLRNKLYGALAGWVTGSRWGRRETEWLQNCSRKTDTTYENRNVDLTTTHTL